MSTNSAKARLGIIAGSGPEAGMDLWSKVLHHARRSHGGGYRGDIDAPHVVVLSVPELGHSMDLPASQDLVWGHLSAAAEQLAPQVDRFAIACNTLYLFEPELRQLGLDAELVSPVDCVRAAWEERNHAPLALLGAAPVTDLAADTSPYKALSHDIAFELPHDPARLHQLIEAIKVEGMSSPQLEAEFGSIVDGLDAPAALLACTELPLVATSAANIELIDVTELLAKALTAE